MTELTVTGHEFHHVGYATPSISRAQTIFEGMGYRMEGDPFSDPLQGVSGRFMVGPGPRIELLENLPGSRMLTPWLDAGTKAYHFAYLVDDVQATLALMRRLRAKVVVAPVPAVAFGGRHIAFVMHPNGWMSEFIERPSPAQSGSNRP